MFKFGSQETGCCIRPQVIFLRTAQLSTSSVHPLGQAPMRTIHSRTFATISKKSSVHLPFWQYKRTRISGWHAKQHFTLKQCSMYPLRSMATAGSKRDISTCNSGFQSHILTCILNNYKFSCGFEKNHSRYDFRPFSELEIVSFFCSFKILLKT